MGFTALSWAGHLSSVLLYGDSDMQPGRGASNLEASSWLRSVSRLEGAQHRADPGMSVS